MDIQKQIDHIEDKRTQKYIQSTVNSLGLLAINAGHAEITRLLDENNMKYEKVARYQPWFNLTGSGYVDVYKYNNEKGTRYAAEFCYRTAIDDYIIISYITSKKPAKNDIILIRKLEKIIKEFSLHEYTKVKKDDNGSVLYDENGKPVKSGKYWGGKTLDPHFQCWECGRKVHWLDSDASGIMRKWEQFQDSYCGC